MPIAQFNYATHNRLWDDDLPNYFETGQFTNTSCFENQNYKNSFFSCTRLGCNELSAVTVATPWHAVPKFILQYFLKKNKEFNGDNLLSYKKKKGP